MSTPAIETWEEVSAAKFGGQSLNDAGRSQHLVQLPVWEARCTCWRYHEHYRRPTAVRADEHVACHQKDCDIHSGAVERWRAMSTKK